MNRIKEYTIKCPWHGCASNYKGYCDHYEKEIKLEAKIVTLNGKEITLLNCKNFEFE